MSRALGLLLAVTSIAAFGCGDANDGTLSSTRLRRNASPPAAGTVDEHDESDVEGADQTDPGNPNATSAPSAPTTQGTAASQFALTLTQDTPTVGLGESVDLDVAIESKNGFSGNVMLAVTGLPAGTSAAPVQATVTGDRATAKVKITAAFDAVASAPNTSVPIVVQGTSGSLTATANASFKVAPRVKLTIPVNIDALRAATVTYRDQWGTAFGANPTTLRTQLGNGIVLTVFNADSKAHVIHGANGFAHGDTNNPVQPNAFEMQNGAPRTRTLNVGTNANGYPHDGASGSGASFRIRVDAAP